MTLLLSEVMELPVLRAALPRLLSGDAHGSVGWVHTSELADIGRLLRPGDLVLTTGIALPDAPEELASFVAGLVRGGAAGIMVELGRRWADLPDSLVRPCRDGGLPLVSLAREVRFAAVAQAVGERIVERQVADLRDAEHVHEIFAQLSISEAGPSEILDATSQLAGAAVALETEEHRVIDYRAGMGDIREFLADWAERSRRVQPIGRTEWDEGNGWLVTRLGRRERGWGRLVIEAPNRPTPRLTVVVERAAAALAMHRLHDRQRDGMTRRLHHELIVGLLNDPTSVETVRRCELVGVPLHGRSLVGVAIRPASAPAPKRPGDVHDEITATVLHAAHEMRTPALACVVDDNVRVLLSTPGTAKVERMLTELAESVNRRHAIVMGAGRAVQRVADCDRTLREAQHVLESVPVGQASARVLHTLEDVHLRGLLALLSDDDRVGLFVDRELEPLLEHDELCRTDLVTVLQAFLLHPSSKAAAAASLNLSRPAFYDRLNKIERVLGLSLDDSHVRVSLHVALLAHDLRRQNQLGRARPADHAFKPIPV